MLWSCWTSANLANLSITQSSFSRSFMRLESLNVIKITKKARIQQAIRLIESRDKAIDWNDELLILWSVTLVETSSLLLFIFLLTPILTFSAMYNNFRFIILYVIITSIFLVLFDYLIKYLRLTRSVGLPNQLSQVSGCKNFDQRKLLVSKKKFSKNVWSAKIFSSYFVHYKSSSLIHKE